MAGKLLAKAVLLWRFLAYTVGTGWSFFRSVRAANKRIKRQQRLEEQKKKKKQQSLQGAAATDDPQQEQQCEDDVEERAAAPFKNILVVGASFAGYHAAKMIAASLLGEGTAAADPAYRVVVVEPSSHLHFTWVLPRFCVLGGHEHKALIPYGPYLAGVPATRLRWVAGRVASVSRGSVRLEGGEVLPYEYLVVATGSGAGEGLPSRFGVAGRVEALARIKDMQRRIEAAGRIVVVGGGAAGVELATDAKDKYPAKDVVLVHSRPAVMNRFGPELQAAALKGLQGLGVEVILNERATVDADGRLVTLKSGKTIACDLFISCIGQRPDSHILAELSPASVSESGHVRVRPSMQIADESLPNIFACGDVTAAGISNPNARAAIKQAMVVAENIALAIKGEPMRETNEAHWADGIIKLTIGLDRSIMHLGDDTTEFCWNSKDKDIALKVDHAWTMLGATPFEDVTDQLAQYRHVV